MLKFFLFAVAAIILAAYGWVSTYYPGILDFILPNREAVWDAFLGWLVRMATTPAGILVIAIAVAVTALIVYAKFKYTGP